MTVRPARAEDAEALAAIANYYIRETTVSFNEVEKTPEDLARAVATRQAAGHGFFVVERDAQVVGFAGYGPFRDGTGYRATLEHSVLLNAHARGAGLGATLMQALEDHARAAGVHSLIGGISAENAAGVRFHQRRGFQEVGRVIEAGWKAGRRIDLILMQKLLLPDRGSL